MCPRANSLHGSTCSPAPPANRSRTACRNMFLRPLRRPQQPPAERRPAAPLRKNRAASITKPHPPAIGWPDPASDLDACRLRGAQSSQIYPFIAFAKNRPHDRHRPAPRPWSNPAVASLRTAVRRPPLLSAKTTARASRRDGQFRKNALAYVRRLYSTRPTGRQHGGEPGLKHPSACGQPALLVECQTRVTLRTIRRGDPRARHTTSPAAARAPSAATIHGRPNDDHVGSMALKTLDQARPLNATTVSWLSSASRIPARRNGSRPPPSADRKREGMP